MNKSAETHLAKAKDHVAKGEEFYRKAADEIIAAQQADSTLSNREAGEFIGYSADWVRDIVSRRTNDEPLGSPWAHQTAAKQQRAAKKALRETPEILAELTPAEQRHAAKVLDTESAKREHERKQIAKAKEREHLGDETVDDLELRETLQSTEYLLIKARGELRGFVKAGGEIGIENTPQAWRESCLDWIDDLEGHLGMAKALLTGDDVDWTKFEDMLEREAN